jgi:hypothetical protein
MVVSLLVLVSVLLAMCSLTSAWNIDPFFTRSFHQKAFAVTAAALSFTAPSVVVADSKSMAFDDFVPYMRSGEVTKVLFRGIRPEGLEAYAKNGDVITVKEGFPAYDNPLSPSGPTQAIALCQHTPGVLVEQDLSELMLKAKTNRRYTGPQAMLESTYPK